MSLSESQAQQILLVQALEQARENGGLWSASDAKEATRATMERLGPKAPFDQFVARRAEWALALISRRPGGEKIKQEKSRWPMVVALSICAGAFVAGLLMQHIVSDGKLRIIGAPIFMLFGVIAFNLWMYLRFLYKWLSRLMRNAPPNAGLMTDLMGRWRVREGFPNAVGTSGDFLSWMPQFQSEWCFRSTALNLSRFKSVFHFASIFFSIGVLLRFFFYAAGNDFPAEWETLLKNLITPERVYKFLNVFFTPGAWLLRMSIPGEQVVKDLQGRGGDAQVWFWLYVGNILAMVVLPRIFLALTNILVVWRQARSFPLPLNSAYFTTLKAIRRGGKVDALVVPFRYELTPQIKSNLARLLERVHGLAVEIAIQQAVLMGEDTADWKAALGRDDHVSVFVIFNLTATAEPDTHARLLKKILNDVGGRAPVIPIVDTGTYPHQDEERFRQRCNQWRTVLDDVRCEPLFVNLTRSNDDDVWNSLQGWLNHHG